MKKAISVLLVVLMVFSLVSPTFAVKVENPVPVVYIAGDGKPLYDAEGNKIFYYRDILNSEKSPEKSAIIESTVNILYPFLVEGLLTDHWDNYYANIQKEISELFSDVLLDKNGEVANGSDIAKSVYEGMERDLSVDKKIGKGYYDSVDYHFWYDWRLDPLLTADKLHDYILRVKEVTGAKKVGLISQCLGTNVAAAYVAKYGMEDLTGISFWAGVMNGAEILSETISGKFKFDANAINRCIIDCEGLGYFSVGEFLTATIDLLEKGQVFDTLIGVTKEKVYYKIVEGVTSALALSTFFTFPCYWACVSAEDYDNAMNYVFGEEGSEKRLEYAGLIEKIENYNEVVRKHLPEIFETVAREGNIAIGAKYGFQMAPICESREKVSDQFISVEKASLGATTSTIYGTLSDEYIAQRVAEGKGKYISPDKQIDASTCQFPDCTWFIKGTSHSSTTRTEESLFANIITADRQITVDETPLGQFMVYDRETDTVSAMTEENCDTYFWKADEEKDKPKNKAQKLTAFLLSLIKWLKEVYLKFFADKAEQAI